jgi:hypothetical protein
MKESDKKCNVMDNEMQRAIHDHQPNPVDQHKPDDLYAEAPVDPSPQHRYPTRSKGPVQEPSSPRNESVLVNLYKRFKKAMFHASLTIKQKNHFGVYTNLTVREAIDKYGDKARKAVMDELKQLLKLKVLKFVHSQTVDKTIRSQGYRARHS